MYEEAKLAPYVAGQSDGASYHSAVCASNNEPLRMETMKSQLEDMMRQDDLHRTRLRWVES